MDFQSIKDLLNYIVSVVGIALTFYYGIRSKRFEKQRDLLEKKNEQLEKLTKSLDFQDLLACANELKSDINKSEFSPEIIFTPGLRGATFANILEDEFRVSSIPVIVGMTFWTGYEMFPDISDYELLESNRWKLLIPKLLFKQKNKRILIVDDFAMDGGFLSTLKNKLFEFGFEKENIRTAVVAITTVTKRNGNKPDFFWHETSDDDFFFPWGKAK